MAKVALISLGCAKNLVDSELILGRLAADGFEITADPDQAEIIIVNTCGFIDQAKQEAADTLLSAAERKKSGLCRIVAAAGCLVQRYGEELAQKMPEIDLWVTRAHYGDFSKLIALASRQPGILRHGPPEFRPGAGWPRLVSTPPHRAYLRIADGCDNRCSYCVIPAVRGSYHSKPLAELVNEAEALARRGAVEITLIAQDTTAYGHDLPGRPDLAELLHALLQIEGPRWWRLLYAYPARIGDDLIDLFAREKRLCRYLDLPLQHISGRILRAMGRPDSPDEIRDLLAKLRARIPGLALRTSLITGFPGETEAEFAELYTFVAEQRFNWLGVFAYSREEGTPAAALPGQLPAAVKNRRRKAILALQQKISRELSAARIGRRFPVLMEQPHPERPGFWLARSEAEAPEVDGLIHVRDYQGEAGEIITVQAVKSGIYDLEAVPVSH